MFAAKKALSQHDSSQNVGFRQKKSTHDFFRLPPKKNLKHFFPDPGAAILFLFLLQFPKTASGPPEFVLRLVLLKRL